MTSIKKTSDFVSLYETKIENDPELNEFILNLENDRNESTTFMHQIIEIEEIKPLQKIDELKKQLDKLNSELKTLSSIPENLKRLKRELLFKIKVDESNIPIKKKLLQAKLNKWKAINDNVDSEKDKTKEEEIKYYMKKKENEITNEELIKEISQMNPVDFIEKNKSIDDLQKDELDMISYINETEINKDEYYEDFFTNLKGIVLTEFENESLAFQIGSPKEIMIPRTPEMNTSIQRVFEKIVPVKKPFYVYRCYYANASVEDINSQPQLGRPTSTSLSYNYSYNWACRNREINSKFSNTDTSNIMICIIIPKGTHVVPMHHYDQKEEYEILLSSKGKLYFTGDRDPKNNVPIFIYFDSNDQFNQYISNNRGGKNNKNKTRKYKYYLNKKKQTKRQINNYKKGKKVKTPKLPNKKRYKNKNKNKYSF